ncbi:hypothetical protein D3C80_1269130 [compost metagenome]
MLQTVDVGTEGGTRLTDLLGEGVQLSHRICCFILSTNTKLDGSPISAFAATNHLCQCFCQRSCAFKLQFLVSSTTNLEGHIALETSLQQVLSTEGGVVGDIVQLVTQFNKFSIHGLAIIGGTGAVRRLGSQILHALNDITHLVHGPFGGLHHGDGILGVAHADLLTAGLGLQAGGHLQAGGVIGGGVDAQTGTQALHGGAQHLVGGIQLVLGGQRGEISVNGQTHDLLLKKAATQRVTLRQGEATGGAQDLNGK